MVEYLCPWHDIWTSRIDLLWLMIAVVPRLFCASISVSSCVCCVCCVIVVSVFRCCMLRDDNAYMWANKRRDHCDWVPTTIPFPLNKSLSGSQSVVWWNACFKFNQISSNQKRLEQNERECWHCRYLSRPMSRILKHQKHKMTFVATQTQAHTYRK